MDFVEVGNVSTTCASGLPGHSEESALLLKSIADNKISFQEGKLMEKICESLRRHAQRSAGVYLRLHAHVHVERVLDNTGVNMEEYISVQLSSESWFKHNSGDWRGRS